MSAAANWIEQAVTSGGTGNLILGASVNEGVTFTQAFGGDQTDILYSVQSAAGQRHIECGLCDYVDATNTITNRRPEATFNGSIYDTTSPSPVGVSPGAIVTTPLTYQAYADLLATIASHTSDGTIHFTQASISIPAGQISDFDTEVANNTTVAANTSKLAGIEDNATADQTAAEIKTAYESNADTNAFTDAEQTKVANALTSTGSIDTHTDVDTSTAAPTTGQILEFDGSTWVPATPAGGITMYIQGTAPTGANDGDFWIDNS